MKYKVNIENSIRMVYAIRFFILLEVKAISKDTPRINEEIRARELRVVGPENEQIGIMSGREALALAEEKHLDLVEIAPNAKPPVARIMNYGKYRYEQQKREKEAKKKQKIVTLKEVKLRPHIEDHDFYVKNERTHPNSWVKVTK